MTTHVLGIRHHGPGSARSVLAALERLRPDALLVEGPPDADDAIALAGDAAMKPPIALLVYASEEPHRAVFYPFARFSPEWVAIRWALARGVPVRFMDLPMAHQLVAGGVREDRASGDPGRDDPIGALGRAAGYEDAEAWWEHQIEQRLDPSGVFEAILEAMSALREGKASGDEEHKREASMRRILRKAEKEFAHVAVVCGAWHAPALLADVKAKDDDALLKGLPKAKITSTWIPWTSSRLAYRSGYGAGVGSPGFYDVVWEAGATAPTRWIARVAQMLRADGIDASPASVIEGVRLAEALAAMRDRAIPGLDDLRDAVRATLCEGDDARLMTIRARLEVGEELGEVAEGAPAVPLQRDLAAQQKTLRLKPSTEIKTLDLDLRQDFDRARSRLLHRLSILGVPWGVQEEAVGKSGTFHEYWKLQFDPEHAVALVEANVYGNTIEAAAIGKARQRLDETDDLAEVTATLNAAVLADLPAVIEHALSRVQALSALSSDVVRMMNALPSLVRVLRWGDVRETDARRVLPIVEGMFERIVVGLPTACASLDDEAAVRVLEAAEQTHGAVLLLDRPADRADWIAALLSIVDRPLHGLLRGGALRLLLELRAIDGAALGRRARLALSPAEEPATAASWLEGLLRGSAVLLLHQDEVWIALDAWLASLNAEVFQELLPLVRRAFSAFEPPERRAIAERIARGGKPVARETEVALDLERVALVKPILSRILGVSLS
ncbi:MAG: hypothetical protein HYV09_27185 [Deltaproteobacteria bacterium]|nr:hypothetical protein [Deltaproteobacteria bacterium]